MIKNSEKGLFDTVIVCKLVRFARNRYDSAHYKAVLRKHGAKVISASEVISKGYSRYDGKCSQMSVYDVPTEHFTRLDF